MLEDQDLSQRQVMALEPSFFRSEETGELDYLFCFEFRVMSESFCPKYDLHLWLLDTDEQRQQADTLQAWGVPLVGETLILPTTPTRDSYRRVQRAVLLPAFYWLREISALYRLSGRKNFSTISPAAFLSALVMSSRDLAPYSIFNYLRQAQL